MSAEDTSGALGQALVDFTTNGAFPEEGVSSLALSSHELPPAIRALSEARSKLEVCHAMPSCHVTLDIAGPDPVCEDRLRSTPSTKKVPPTSPRG